MLDIYYRYRHSWFISKPYTTVMCLAAFNCMSIFIFIWLWPINTYHLSVKLCLSFPAYQHLSWELDQSLWSGEGLRVGVLTFPQAQDNRRCYHPGWPKWLSKGYKNGCPMCSGSKFSVTNSLLNVNRITKAIIKYWTPKNLLLHGSALANLP